MLWAFADRRMLVRLKVTRPTVEEFKVAVGAFASSVTVITVRDREGRPQGMTATAFCSVSFDPLLVLVCVNSSSGTYDRILRSGSFGVNVLSSASQEVSAYCARPGADKYLPAGWLSDQGQVCSAPAMEGALAYLDCEVFRRFPAGTHGVVIGRVHAVGLDDPGPGGVEEATSPLIHFRGGYRQLAADRRTLAADRRTLAAAP